MDNKLELMRKGKIAQIKEEIEKLEVHLENNINIARMALFRTNGVETIEIDNAIEAISEVAKALRKYRNLKARLQDLHNES